jgi:starvation-inducible DNA-binding protein
MSINTGIDNRQAIADSLAKYLASTYTLYLKTQNFHWNVVSPDFYQLHLLFEAQYNELAAATDELAERIRALGYRAPASFAEYLKLSSIQEEPKSIKAKDMIAQLLAGHQIMVREGQAVIKVAEHVGDASTADMVIGRLEAHEKAAWMLRSILEV